MSEELDHLHRELEVRSRELTEALQQQSAMADILKTISRSNFDLPAVLNALVATAARLCGATFGGIFVRQGESFKGATVGLEGKDLAEFMELSLPIDRSTVSGRVVLLGRTVNLPDIEADPDYDLAAIRAITSVRSMLGVPLLREGKVEGVFFLGRRELGTFSDRQSELVQTFADQAMIAIENVRLFDEVRARSAELTEALQQQTATADVLKAISRSTFNLEAVLNTLVESAARLCGATVAQIARWDGSRLRWAAGFALSPEYLDIQKDRVYLPGRDSLVGRTALNRQITIILDVQADPEYGYKDHAKVGNFRTIVGVPLLRSGELIGVMGLARQEVEPYTDKQIELVKTFADQAVIAIENARLFEEVKARTRELQEALDHQTATSEVLNAISRSPAELQPVLDVIIETAVRLCEADGGTIARQRDGHFIRSGQYGFSEEFAELMGRAPVEMTRGTITGRTLLEGKVVHIMDALADAEYTWSEALKLESIRTLLGVPLLRDGVPIGAIALVRRTVRPFSSKQIELVTTFADQAVIAIENARLFQEVQARNRELTETLEQQTATSSILRVIAASPTDIQPVLNAVAESAGRLCEAFDSIIFLQDGDLLVRRAHHGAIPLDFASRPIARDWVTGRAFIDRAPVHVHDLMQAGHDYPISHADAVRQGHRTILAVPLLREGEAIGALAIRRLEMRPFSQKQIDLLTTFADQAAIAIENVRLFEQVQARTAELDRSVGELRALGEVSQAVNSSLDLKTVLETIVAKAVQLSHTDAGAIYVYSKSTDKFRLRATYGMSPELIAAISGQAIGLNDAGIGEAARLREPVQVPDLGESAATVVQQIVLEAGFRGVLVVPLLRPNKVIGALVVRRRRPGRFSDSTVQLLETFAAQSVLAIQNARLFSEAEEKGRQLEIASRHKSQFLANMSHELRTPLNSVLGFTEMLADGLYGELPDKAKATLGRIQANGRHLLGLINDVLDLSKIEAGQLTMAMENYSIGQIVKTVAAATEPLARAKGLELSTTVADGLPLGCGDERRLTQVLLNLAGNAVKFTDKGSINIAARSRDGVFELMVHDTGPGIALEHQRRIFEEFQQVDESSTRQKGGTGLGLAISKRIVEMHGGSISVESSPGSGSTFTIAIPIKPNE